MIDRRKCNGFELEYVHYSNIIKQFSFYYLLCKYFLLLDCSESKNASESSWITTTESIDLTTSPSIDSTQPYDLDVDLEDDEDFTMEPIEYVDNNSADNIEFETTTTQPRSSRRKRHANFPGSGDYNEYTMEVMVAVDRKMQQYHGNNIQAYVLTLMSIVSNIYADASIGNSINVAVVHILLLKDDLHIESNHNGER